MIKIYIAGKVTGENPEQCAAKFRAAADALRAAGFEPVNPIEVVNNPQCAWSDAMRLCIAAMMDCKGVLLLPCHRASSGAQIEKRLATDVGMIVSETVDSLRLRQWYEINMFK